MKKVIFLFLLSIPLFAKSQDRVEWCTNFDDSVIGNHFITLLIDSGSIWEIGQPDKPVFTDSYNDSFSIVTSLNSNYKDNDTSSFTIKYEQLPHYLSGFEPLDINFYHRFKTDSLKDFGLIELSLDKGNTWYNLNDTNTPWYNSYTYYHSYRTIHVNQQTGDTMNNIHLTGNSDGWLFSNYSVNLNAIVYQDSLWTDPNFDFSHLHIRFSMISDSLGNDDGWQIDKLCIRIDQISSINKISNQNRIRAFPNPGNGKVELLGKLHSGTLIQVISSNGTVVLSDVLKNDVDSLILNLNSGIFFVNIIGDSSHQTIRLIIE